MNRRDKCIKLREERVIINGNKLKKRVVIWGERSESSSSLEGKVSGSGNCCPNIRCQLGMEGGNYRPGNFDWRGGKVGEFEILKNTVF